MPPKTNTSPKEGLFQPLIFRGHLSFQWSNFVLAWMTPQTSPTDLFCAKSFPFGSTGFVNSQNPTTTTKMPIPSHLNTLFYRSPPLKTNEYPLKVHGYFWKSLENSWVFLKGWPSFCWSSKFLLAVVPKKFTSKGAPATMTEMAPRLANLGDGSRKGPLEMHTKNWKKNCCNNQKNTKKCVITVNRSWCLDTTVNHMDLCLAGALWLGGFFGFTSWPTW